MSILNNLRNIVWSNIQATLLLDLESSKNIIIDAYKKIKSGKKSVNDYSKQIQIALEIYTTNYDLLTL